VNETDYLYTDVTVYFKAGVDSGFYREVNGLGRYAGRVGSTFLYITVCQVESKVLEMYILCLLENF